MTIEHLPNHVQLMVQQVADDNGFKATRAELVGEANQGDNYVGQVYRVTLHDEGDSSTENINLIIKCAPQNPKRRELLRIKYLFDKEIFMYESVFPAMLSALKTKGVVPKTQEAFPSTPLCYKTRNTGDGADGTIIMENVSSQGFEMLDRFAGLDVEHCRAVLREQAKFHASSIVLQETDPETFQRLKESCPESLVVPEWIPAYKGFADRAKDIIHARFPSGTPEWAKFEEFAHNYYDIMEELTSLDPRLSVFCHSDNWTNNILFKYGKNQSVPDEVCFIDFQLSRFASPLTDLAYFIFCSTTKAMRDKHFKGLLKDYHNFLCSALKEFGCTDDKIVTWDEMQSLYQKYMKFGLGMAIINIPITTSQAGDLHNTDEVGDASKLDEVFISKAEANPLCIERLGDVLLDTIKYGYI